MIHRIDERRNIEAQIARSLCLEVGRGTYRAGEPLPSPDRLATELLVNPHRVSAVYQELCDAGIATFVTGQGYVLVSEAVANARRRLLETFQLELASDIDELAKSGCSSREIQSAIEATHGGRSR